TFTDTRFSLKYAHTALETYKMEDSNVKSSTNGRNSSTNRSSPPRTAASTVNIDSAANTHFLNFKKGPLNSRSLYHFSQRRFLGDNLEIFFCEGLKIGWLKLKIFSVWTIFLIDCFLKKLFAVVYSKDATL